ncbi:hypothetical protein ZIOFF_058117 [Zingiber officinale]|uniref:Uncharacterized protein n=2 Tax=Zingiber officinale TaxID=94328 RepID=A0A8J5F8E7_ZINOF|nr:hypothetical protein ZIOFF_058117 [Zingiber officinale]
MCVVRTGMTKLATNLAHNLDGRCQKYVSLVPFSDLLVFPESCLNIALLSVQFDLNVSMRLHVAPRMVPNDDASGYINRCIADSFPSLSPSPSIKLLRRGSKYLLSSPLCWSLNFALLLRVVRPLISSVKILGMYVVLCLESIDMEFEGRYKKVQSQGGRFDCLLFDLDDTLYPLSSGMAAECRKNIGEYMLEKLGIEESKIPDLCSVLYQKYGTTMAGLRAIGYNFNYDDYHSFVHGRLPYETLKPDPVLRQLLLSLPIRKAIFTNADRDHAARVLKRLGLEDCFEGVICFETLNQPSSSSGEETSSNIFDIVGYLSTPDPAVDQPKTPILCKPSVEAMEQALRIANFDPQRTVFFDDSARNIQSAKAIGLHTVLVGTSQRVKGADHALESIHNVREALPELWEEAEKSSNIRPSNNVTMETSVTA